MRKVQTQRVSSTKRGHKKVALRFDRRLVLYQWLLTHFDVSSLEHLTAGMKNIEYEGLDESNTSHFHHMLKQLCNNSKLSHDLLLAYDQNIVRHWERITERRSFSGPYLYPKYFQYFSLLFTEIYLDRYFRDPKILLAQLNDHVENFNCGKYLNLDVIGSPVPEASRIEPYSIRDLNKVAFWMATGSGKTLLMHINILQYLHYLNIYGGKKMNRVILLTPNEGLSHQHLEEFQLSGFYAELFAKEGSSYLKGLSVDILDIHKLREEMGEKTVALSAFEGNNLILVDEGHRGTSGAQIGAWIQKRNMLCENGFSFEYSATFGQAMKASSNRALEQIYAKCILFDYSYKHFYGDGYGKDYRILNLADDSDDNIRQQYFTACLLTFYQQLKLYKEQTGTFRPYLLERPLWIFVGSSVNAVRIRNSRKISDVVDILMLLATFVRNRSETEIFIERLLTGYSGLFDVNRRELFHGAFQYLNSLSLKPNQIYDDILRVLFNAPAAAAIYIENLKGTDGEVALRLGDNETFGVINVGDASALCNLCDEHTEFVVTERQFAGSHFRKLNSDSSKVNILIGSKKFIEGWSSWRVSTMGLMNIGRNEGPQIIQLFGRGVRLKGRGFSLKRSRHMISRDVPKNIEALETLNIFGIRADYMHQFKEYLEDEDLQSIKDRTNFILPVISRLGSKKLKVIRLRDGVDFNNCRPSPIPDEPPDFLVRHPVVLDWHPKLQALASGVNRCYAQVAEREQQYFEDTHLAFLDFDTIYFEIQQYKSIRALHNLSISRNDLLNILGRKDWYVLYIPKEEMHFRSYQQIHRWQEIVIVLLKKYLDRLHKFRKQEFESGNLEYCDLSTDDPNIIKEYQLLIDQSRDDIVQKLVEIKKLIEVGDLRNACFQSLQTIAFDRHLYDPLIYSKNDLVSVKPVVLENESERDFVLDLQKFCENNGHLLGSMELYLLRNMGRGRGIGFFEAGNFYPDFILWLLSKDRQYVNFIDPKGLRYLEGPNDPKIQFHLTIKDLESQIGDSTVVLNSFIISNTRVPEVNWWGKGMTKKDFEDRNVIFQREDRSTYIGKLIEMAAPKIDTSR